MRPANRDESLRAGCGARCNVDDQLLGKISDDPAPRPTSQNDPAPTPPRPRPGRGHDPTS